MCGRGVFAGFKLKLKTERIENKKTITSGQSAGDDSEIAAVVSMRTTGINDEESSAGKPAAAAAAAEAA